MRGSGKVENIVCKVFGDLRALSFPAFTRGMLKLVQFWVIDRATAVMKYKRQSDRRSTVVISEILCSSKCVSIGGIKNHDIYIV